jgi:hypothetical protein
VNNLRPEARGPLKSGAWGGRPTCHLQTPPVQSRVTFCVVWNGEWNVSYIRSIGVLADSQVCNIHMSNCSRTSNRTLCLPYLTCFTPYLIRSVDGKSLSRFQTGNLVSVRWRGVDRLPYRKFFPRIWIHCCVCIPPTALVVINSYRELDHGLPSVL